LVALAFTTVVSIAVAFIVVQPYAVEWRWASELPPWEQVPLEPTELIAADTIPIDRVNARHGRIHDRADGPFNRNRPEPARSPEQRPR
jgi:hypothetical protein